MDTQRCDEGEGKPSRGDVVSSGRIIYGCSDFQAEVGSWMLRSDGALSGYFRPPNRPSREWQTVLGEEEMDEFHQDRRLHIVSGPVSRRLDAGMTIWLEKTFFSVAEARAATEKIEEAAAAAN